MERTGKAEIAYLDTHVLLWLHDGLVDKLSGPAVAAVENSHLLYSPMAELELQYLHEIGRFRPNSEQALRVLADEIGICCGSLEFAEVVTAAITVNWTRDPFDRLIVAEAMRAGAKLITRDLSIRENFPSAVW